MYYSVVFQDQNLIAFYCNVYVHHVFDLKTLSCLCLFHSVDTVEAAFTMEPEEFKANYGKTKPPLDSQELVFHCHMGKRGGMAMERAHKLGYVK